MSEGIRICTALVKQNQNCKTVYRNKDTTTFISDVSFGDQSHCELLYEQLITMVKANFLKAAFV
jgi:hypothetical protein